MTFLIVDRSNVNCQMGCILFVEVRTMQDMDWRLEVLLFGTV